MYVVESKRQICVCFRLFAQNLVHPRGLMMYGVNCHPFLLWTVPGIEAGPYTYVLGSMAKECINTAETKFEI